MAKLLNFSPDGEVQCDACDAIFTLHWQRRIDIDRVEYCPFCGDDIEELEQ